MQRNANLPVGTILDERYEVRDLIGEGGMGCVYLGHQIRLDRSVAIKTLLPDLNDQEEAIIRFKREVRAVQRLTHPNTIRIYDYGETDEGLLFLVMEYLEGLTLDQVLLQAGPLPAEQVEEIGIQALGSLIEAHTVGVVHRDIKPSNLMLCHQLGARDTVKVLDFGLARGLAEELSVSATVPGTTVGTPTYMSPEQLSGQELDQRTDLYSLGHTLYELLTGTPFFNGWSVYDIAMFHACEKHPDVPQNVIGTRLGLVLDRALRTAPSSRYQSATQMLEALSGKAMDNKPSVMDSQQLFPSMSAFGSIETPQTGTPLLIPGTAPTSRPAGSGTWQRHSDQSGARAAANSPSPRAISSSIEVQHPQSGTNYLGLRETEKSPSGSAPQAAVFKRQPSHRTPSRNIKALGPREAQRPSEPKATALPGLRSPAQSSQKLSVQNPTPSPDKLGTRPSVVRSAQGRPTPAPAARNPRQAPAPSARAESDPRAATTTASQPTGSRLVPNDGAVLEPSPPLKKTAWYSANIRVLIGAVALVVLTLIVIIVFLLLKN